MLRENKIRRNQEHFWVVGLDNEHKILFIELTGLGALNRANAGPTDVFRTAIYKLAVKMILFHNHPNGSTNDWHRIIPIGAVLWGEITNQGFDQGVHYI